MTMDVERTRFNMVEQQVRPWDVGNPRVLEALSHVPRERYVPVAHRALAFADLSLPLAHGEVMMKPVLEGRLLQALDVQNTDTVLEIGTGSGFVTACLAYLGREVHSIEIHGDLAEQARLALNDARVANVSIQTGDALAESFRPEREFDVIAVTGAVHREPRQFRRMLKPGGRMFVVCGESPVMEALLITRIGASEYSERSLFETDLAYLRGAEPKKRFVF